MTSKPKETFSQKLKTNCLCALLIVVLIALRDYIYNTARVWGIDGDTAMLAVLSSLALYVLIAGARFERAKRYEEATRLKQQEPVVNAG